MIQPEAPVRSDSFRPVLGVTALLLVALLAIAALKSSRDLESARARERSLRAQIAVTRASSERLRVRIERLRHDPGMLERLAREDLGMVRAGDVVVELPEAAAPVRPAPQAVQARTVSPATKPTPAAGWAAPPAPPVPRTPPSAAPSSPPPGRG